MGSVPRPDQPVKACNMPDNGDELTAEAAEKAYEAAAAEAVVKADVAAPSELTFPAKQERVVTAAAEPVGVVAVEAAVAQPAVAKAAPVVAKKPAPAPKKAPKTAPQTAKAAPKKAAPAKTSPAKAPIAKAPVATAPIKAVAAAKPAPKPAVSPFTSIKETIMATKTKTDFTKTIKTAAADVQAKAKAVFAKGSEAASEVVEFSKGNVDAVVTSGKILGAGLKGLGETYVAEGKAAVETVTADVKQLAAVKSPAEFVTAQGAILRKNFDHAIDFNTKTGETMLKLFDAAFAPISARANLVVEKIKKAA